MKKIKLLGNQFDESSIEESWNKKIINTSDENIKLLVMWKKWNIRLILVDKDWKEEDDLNNIININNIKIAVSEIIEWAIVWIIWRWNFKFLDFYSDSHNVIRISKKYRWKWLWTLLLKTKEEIDWIQEYEYSRKIVNILFLINNWYEVLWFYSDWKYEKVNEYNLSVLTRFIEEWLINSEIEKKFNKVVILKKT